MRVSTLVQGKEDKTGIARQEDGFQRWLGQHPDYTPWDEKFEDIENLLLRVTKLEVLH